jgi:hypothetical protein
VYNQCTKHLAAGYARQRTLSIIQQSAFGCFDEIPVTHQQISYLDTPYVIWSSSSLFSLSITKLDWLSCNPFSSELLVDAVGNQQYLKLFIIPPDLNSRISAWSLKRKDLNEDLSKQPDH